MLDLQDTFNIMMLSCKSISGFLWAPWFQAAYCVCVCTHHLIYVGGPKSTISLTLLSYT